MIGDILKEIRQEHNLTQEQMSQLLGIKQNVYSGYETNRHMPRDVFIIIKIADTFKISTDYILGRYKK